MSGETVNMYGGTNNTGIVMNQYSGAAQPVPPALLEAIEELTCLLRELRNQVAPATARVIDDSLPALSSQASPPQERHRALIAVATIAATAGALGQPVLEAVNRVAELLANL
ncbi:hypothetical protein NGF19_23325 [Streptomyces sp. RY43-2]|uniref:Uncharacterized protein n=1 Tax=Streptomyces macrolidinus TaxID=2952607 RepID=A0ABT0ZJE0_9ACTN|nr:hypothetical protein [Streptomyces macrolidinus]MCN9243683.1 hypothetical protein [Streptomyces macrolidinus]